jgi:hypothetical protein
MSIFGISLLDNFGFDFLTNLITEFRVITLSIIDYLSNSQFYNYLKDLFSNSERSIGETSEKINNDFNYLKYIFIGGAIIFITGLG